MLVRNYATRRGLNRLRLAPLLIAVLKLPQLLEEPLAVADLPKCTDPVHPEKKNLRKIANHDILLCPGSTINQFSGFRLFFRHLWSVLQKAMCWNALKQSNDTLPICLVFCLIFCSARATCGKQFKKPALLPSGDPSPSSHRLLPPPEITAKNRGRTPLACVLKSVPPRMVVGHFNRLLMHSLVKMREGK